MRQVPRAVQILCQAARVDAPERLPPYLRMRMEESLQPLLEDPLVDNADTYVIDEARRIVVDWCYLEAAGRMNRACARLEALLAAKPSFWSRLLAVFWATPKSPAPSMPAPAPTAHPASKPAGRPKTPATSRPEKPSSVGAGATSGTAPPRRQGNG